MDTRVGAQTRLLGTAGVTGMAALVSRQIRLLGFARVIERATRSWETLAELTRLVTRSKKQEVPVGLLTRKARLTKIWLTQKAGVRRSRPTRKAGLQKIWLTRKAGVLRSWLT
jgi:hypothetical protein